MPGTKHGQRHGDPHGRSELRITNLRARRSAYEPAAAVLSFDSALHATGVWYKIFRDTVQIAMTRERTLPARVLPGEDHIFEVIDVGPLSGDAAYDVSFAVAIVGGNKALISWDLAAGAFEYPIFWDAGDGSIDFGTPYVVMKDTGAARQTWLTPALGAGTYKFTVRGRDAAGNETTNTTALTVVLTAPPKAPRGLILAVNHTKLTAAVDASVTTLLVLEARGFPASGEVLIGTEEIAYSGRTATSFTGCTRGANGSTPAAHVVEAAVDENNAGSPEDTHNTLYWTDPPDLPGGGVGKVRIYFGEATPADEWDQAIGSWPAIDYTFGGAGYIDQVNAGVETYDIDVIGPGPQILVYGLRAYDGVLEEKNTDCIARVEIGADETDYTARPAPAERVTVTPVAGGKLKIDALIPADVGFAEVTGVKVWYHTNQANVIAGTGTEAPMVVTASGDGWRATYTTPALVDATLYYVLVRGAAGAAGAAPYSPFRTADVKSATADSTAPAVPANQTAAASRGGKG